MNGHFRVDTNELASLSSAVVATATSLAGSPFHQSVPLDGCGSGLVNESAAESDDHLGLRAIILEADLRACAGAIDSTVSSYEVLEAELAAKSSGGGNGGGSGDSW